VGQQDADSGAAAPVGEQDTQICLVSFVVAVEVAVAVTAGSVRQEVKLKLQLLVGYGPKTRPNRKRGE